jgi:phage baseplate assembly protein W
MKKIIGYTTVGEQYDARYLTDLELAKQDLKNHFNIRKGEKWTNPEFGSNLPLYVFQPLDDQTLYLIEQDVSDVVMFDPRFELLEKNVVVVHDAGEVTVSIKLMYLPTTTVTDLILKFDDEFQEDREF